MTYVPAHFAFPDDATAALHEVIEANSFGILVASEPTRSDLEAAHLPFVLDRRRGARGTLIAHVARANPIWTMFSEEREALAIFRGAHAYVSPHWYTTPGLVPTWNYVAVHAYGTPRILTADSEVTDALARLSRLMEEGLRPKPPWTMAEMSARTLSALKRGIVAFEIEIGRLEGKQKLSQNRAAVDRAAGVDALEARGAPDDVAVAQRMRAMEPRD